MKTDTAPPGRWELHLTPRHTPSLEEAVTDFQFILGIIREMTPTADVTTRVYGSGSVAISTPERDTLDTLSAVLFAAPRAASWARTAAVTRARP